MRREVEIGTRSSIIMTRDIQRHQHVMWVPNSRLRKTKRNSKSCGCSLLYSFKCSDVHCPNHETAHTLIPPTHFYSLSCVNRFDVSPNFFCFFVNDFSHIFKYFLYSLYHIQQKDILIRKLYYFVIIFSIQNIKILCFFFLSTTYILPDLNLDGLVIHYNFISIKIPLYTYRKNMSYMSQILKKNLNRF